MVRAQIYVLILILKDKTSIIINIKKSANLEMQIKIKKLEKKIKKYIIIHVQGSNICFNSHFKK